MEVTRDYLSDMTDRQWQIVRQHASMVEKPEQRA